MKIDTTNQKFQIGDICKIVRADNSFRYPKIKDEEEVGYGLYVMIVGSYGQIFPNINKYDVNSYEVYVPYHLNEQTFNHDGSNILCEVPNGFCSVREDFIGTGWSWVTSKQLDFVRKPNGNDLESLKTYCKTFRWKEYQKDYPVWYWDSWEEMAKQYL